MLCIDAKWYSSTPCPSPQKSDTFPPPAPRCTGKLHPTQTRSIRAPVTITHPQHHTPSTPSLTSTIRPLLSSLSYIQFRILCAPGSKSHHFVPQQNTIASHQSQHLSYASILESSLTT
mmetsp:Transcript_7509/g.28188  ORF Transcript_7509/g.28188 Transcript_7509/m.28188 type:complete len:118 (+) Transcript_7509:134-487(+)